MHVSVVVALVVVIVLHVISLQHLRIEDHWMVNGTHYQKTLEAWLVVMDSKKDQVLPVLAKAYGEENALKW